MYGSVLPPNKVLCDIPKKKDIMLTVGIIGLLGLSAARG